VQGSIEQVHATTGITGIPAQGAQVVGPVFAHAEQISAGVGFQMVDPVVKKVAVDVLDGIDPKAIGPNGCRASIRPNISVRPALWIIDIQVTTHQVVVVAPLQIDLVFKAFAE
jgi:hypothetical protein